MIEKLKTILNKYEEINQKMLDPELMGDLRKSREIAREHKQLKHIAKASQEYVDLYEERNSHKELINSKDTDSDIKELAYEEISEMNEKLERMEEHLRVLLIPRDPNDLKNCIVEIRAGTGGDEAGIFVGDLFRMYERYSENQDIKIEIINFNESERGGFKEITFTMAGEDVYGNMKFESGVHRVQRVPETESSGRLHTSAATVAILPEAEDIDIEVNDEDLRVDIFRAGGKGGQNVNKVETAVRIVHNPSGIVVSCQEERSQLKNREKAMKVLRSRLYEQELKKQQDKISSSRKSMVRSGDRSEKIRTYNYPQNRVTDHRLEGDAKNYPLKEIVEGDLSRLMENLKIAERTELLNQGVEM